MNQSLFIEYVKKWFGALVASIATTINGANKESAYLFQQMLRKELAPDNKWESVSGNDQIVAADVVALDSPLPLKSRPTLTKASGDLPKLGLKRFKGEKDISAIRVLDARHADESAVVQKLFDDVAKCIKGMYERLEFMFLRALATGIMLVEDSENVGTGIRVTFGYKEANKNYAAVAWGNQGYKPITDLENAIEMASENGDVITHIVCSRATYNKIRQSQEGKELYGAIVGLKASNIVTPTPTNFNQAFEDNYKIQFIVVDKKVRYEKDGIATSVQPFNDGVCVLLTNNIVGKLAYGILAEEDSPVSSVEYQKVDDYILLGKYSQTDPLREYTKAEAIAMPVLENVNSIYLQLATVKPVEPQA